MIISDYCSHENGLAILRQPLERYLHDDIVSDNADVIRQLNLIDRTAQSDAPIMIEGEKGTGKEHFAQYAYARSRRFGRQYTYFNALSVSSDRYGAELFGSAAGQEGLLSRTNGGTLFINDVNLLPQNIQRQLLTAISIPRVSGGKPEFDIRLIGSYTCSEDDPGALSGLTEELYYYISILKIQVPPLRRRREDILLLAMFFLDQANQSYGLHSRFGWDVLASMLEMDWPDNIRQLKYTVERMIWLTEGDVIDNMALLADCAKPMGNTAQAREARFPEHIPENETRSLKEMVADYERMIIRQYIKQYGSLRKAAKALQVAPASLSRKLNAADEEEE